MPLHPLFAPLEPLLASLSPVYAVGGAVRAVLCKESLEGVEIDLTTPNDIAAIATCLKNCGIPVNTQGLKWLSISFEWQGKTYDLTQFRQDAYTSGSRYPTVTATLLLEEDAQRRDFTCNAIYLAPDGTFSDPTGGVADLQNGIIRFIGNPLAKMEEDPLRALRCARFCARYGAKGLTNGVVQALNTILPRARQLPEGRIRKEILKTRSTPHLPEVSQVLASSPFGGWWQSLLR